MRPPPLSHDTPQVVRLRTARLVLRAFSADDALALRDFVCDAQYWQALPIDPPTLSSIRASIDQSGRDAAAVPRTVWSFAAVETASRYLVGEGALRLGAQPWQGEIGWGVDLARAGEGFGTEIGAALLHLAFAELRLHRVVARCRSDNAASRRIMAKLGFREEGIARHDVRARGAWWDSLQAAILEHEWRKD